MNRQYRISTPLFVSFVLVVLAGCTPYFKGVAGYFFFWIIIVSTLFFKIGTPVYQRCSTILMSTILYVSVILIYRLLGISTAKPGYYLGLLLFYMVVLLLPIVPNDELSKKAKKLWWCIMIIILFNVVDNIRLSILYPEINLIRFYLDSDFLSSINAGGGSFYTLTLFFFCVCYFVWLNTEQRKLKWFSLVAAVVTAIYICGFCFKASVVLYFILSAVLIYYAKKTQNRTSFVFVALLSGFVVVSLVGNFSNEFINLIETVSPNERLTMRFVTLVDENADEAHEATITGRTNLYMLSVKTWLTNTVTFFFGIGDHYTVLDPAKTGIGQHASLLDLLGRYGILGASLVFIMLKKSFSYILSLFSQEYRLQIGAIFLVYILCGLTKEIFEAGIGCVLFILLPLSATVLDKSKNNSSVNNKRQL